MRNELIAAVLGLQVIIFIVLVIFWNQMKNFLSLMPAIKNQKDMNRFKSIVKRQMYAALIFPAFSVIMILIFLYGVKSGALAAGDLVYIIIPSVLLLLFSKFIKQTEMKLRNIKTDDPNLKKERDRVVSVWIGKAFPDW